MCSFTSLAIVGLCCLIMLPDTLYQRDAAILTPCQHVVGEFGKNITLWTNLSQVPTGSTILWTFGSQSTALVDYFDGKVDNRFIGKIDLDIKTAWLSIINLRLNDSEIYNGQVLIKSSQEEEEHHYYCFNITVKAPVDGVSMELKDDMVTCISRGIYPRPTLTWSTNPPTNINLYNITDMVITTPDGLYDISSSLSFTAEDIKLDYICSVVTEGRGKIATLSHLPAVSIPASAEVEIPCKAPSSALKDFFRVTWRFNLSETILDYISTKPCTPHTNKWKGLVKGVSELGALQLSASSEKLEGVYISELCHSNHTYVTYAELKIIHEGGGSVGAIVGVALAVVGIIIIIIAAIYLYRFLKQRGGEQGTPDENDHLQTSKV